MHAPGGLNELGAAARAAWAESLGSCLEACVPDGHPYLIGAPDRRMPHRTGPDWIGLPLRVAECLGRPRALRLLDRDRRLQEEYVEWRTVREGGRIRRVELTTELRDYWRVLAAHEPERTLDLIGELTGARATARRVYGVADPLDLEPGARERRFVENFVERPNALNDGREGICFMTHRSNDVSALVLIAAAGAQRCTTRERGWTRCASADEAIPLLKDAAMARRASDPVIVERLGRLAFERRLVAFDDPVGVSIQGFEHGRLRTPGGEPLPREWLTYGRGVARSEAPDGVARRQRLVLEVPRGEKFTVSDLVDAATEQPVRHGGQIAELVQLRLLLRTSEPGLVRAGKGLDAQPVRRRRDACADLRAATGG